MTKIPSTMMMMIHLHSTHARNIASRIHSSPSYLVFNFLVIIYLRTLITPFPIPHFPPCFYLPRHSPPPLQHINHVNNTRAHIRPPRSNSLFFIPFSFFISSAFISFHLISSAFVFLIPAHSHLHFEDSALSEEYWIPIPYLFRTLGDV